MSLLQQAVVRNKLLRALSQADFNLLQPHLNRLITPLRMPMFMPDKDVEHLHFPEQGFTSITGAPPNKPVEINIIGREGLVGAAPVMLGARRCPQQAFVQMAGESLRIELKAFEHAIAHSSTMSNLFLRYVQVLWVQAAQTVISSGTYGIDARLARWLLMCHDRVDGDEFQVTHEFLANMLGVRRPGVTIAMQILEGHRLIKARRGSIRILDRNGLERFAGASYGAAEAEYDRLIGDATVANPRDPTPTDQSGQS